MPAFKTGPAFNRITHHIPVSLAWIHSQAGGVSEENRCNFLSFSGILKRFMSGDKENKSAIEALLFLSGEVMTAASLKDVLEVTESETRRLVGELVAEYRERNSGVLIVEIAHGYQMVTNPEYAEWIKKFRSTHTSNKLSMPALETLAIVAYKQPIIRAEIEQIRGVNSDSAIKTLYEKRLIKIMGRKEAPGRPFLYGTTREFLQYFGLKDLTELPALKDLVREEAA
jgi:segregation and condensation protein B